MQFQPFHSDLLCGVLALFCLSPAAKGGETILASSWNVYNELAETHPDLIHTLQRDDWVHDTYIYSFLCIPPFYMCLVHLYRTYVIVRIANQKPPGQTWSESSIPLSPFTPPQRGLKADSCLCSSRTYRLKGDTPNSWNTANIRSTSRGTGCGEFHCLQELN
jgi:hypothetical protein